MTRMQHDLTLLRIALIGAFIVACPTLLLAQGRVSNSHNCGNHVGLRLSSSAAAQGGLLEAQVRSVSPLDELKADWAGHTVLFWSDTGHRNVRHTLLGVDVERPSGEYEFVVSGQLQTGEPVSCNALISVKAGHFAIEKLQVGREFVEISPEDSKRAEEEHDRVKQLFADATPDRLWQGRFRMPLDGVGTGSNFGRRRILNGQPRSPHTGLDLPAAQGTSVHAAQQGRVVLAENLFFTGNTVILDHGLGVYTLYGHLESMSVAVGDVVRVGTILGRVGATGRATGPHLHWGLTVNEARVNPLQIVRLSPD